MHAQNIKARGGVGRKTRRLVGRKRERKRVGSVRVKDEVRVAKERLRKRKEETITPAVELKQ